MERDDDFYNSDAYKNSLAGQAEQARKALNDLWREFLRLTVGRFLP